MAPITAYSALLKSFQQPTIDQRQRKRRKLDIRESVSEVDDVDSEDEDAAVEVDDESEEDEERDGALSSGIAIDAEDEEAVDDTDPFEVHFANPENNRLSRRLEAIQTEGWRTERAAISKNNSATVCAPKCVHGNIIQKSTLKTASDLPLKKRLKDHAVKHVGDFNHVQQAVAPYMSNYIDVLFGSRKPSNASSLRSLACLHALNHVLKGRDRILKNDDRLRRNASNENIDARDQGFTRPKVLILLETRQMCAKYADCIAQLFGPDQQENKQRFKDAFEGTADDRENLPEDYRELFEGNNDNNFLTAIKLNRKSLKYYSAFYSSDIILASPLGLSRILESEDSKKRDYDFLSSIEILIIDQADAMQMQNWTHVESVLSHLNLEPKELHGCDISRLRQWYSEKRARYLRQTIMFTQYITPEMMKVFNSTMVNVAGKAKFLDSSEGTIVNIGLGIKQTFSRFESTSPSTDPDARFHYFTTALLPSLLRLPKPAEGGQSILIFIPSYFDFLRVRNFFASSTLTQDVSFGAIHDYTDISAQRRARSHFLSGKHSILLYTQRAHHFYRLRIRGVKRVAMYGLPDNPIFYEEIIGGYLGGSINGGGVAPAEASARMMFSKWDSLKLERIVGASRIKSMLGGKGDTFDFV